MQRRNGNLSFSGDLLQRRNLAFRPLSTQLLEGTVTSVTHCTRAAIPVELSSFEDSTLGDQFDYFGDGDSRRSIIDRSSSISGDSDNDNSNIDIDSEIGQRGNDSDDSQSARSSDTGDSSSDSAIDRYDFYYLLAACLLSVYCLLINCFFPVHYLFNICQLYVCCLYTVCS